MSKAIFGYTGFVGSNLDKQIEFSHRYNSSNSQESSGLEFESVYFSAARAEKWKINQNPESDKTHIEELKSVLSNLRTQQLILISTVDVFKHPIGVNEDSPLELSGLHPYGLHRSDLEKYVQDSFENALIVRLPGLFGPGLKKNIIYDLLHNNNIDSINPEGSLQYYEVPKLSEDINIAVENNLELVHLTSEPILSDTIAEEIFGISLNANQKSVSLPPTYDMRTSYASLYSGSGEYTYSGTNQLKSISRFVESERAKS